MHETVGSIQRLGDFTNPCLQNGRTVRFRGSGVGADAVSFRPKPEAVLACEICIVWTVYSFSAPDVDIEHGEIEVHTLNPNSAFSGASKCTVSQSPIFLYNPKPLETKNIPETVVIAMGFERQRDWKELGLCVNNVSFSFSVLFVVVVWSSTVCMLHVGGSGLH